MGWSSGSSLMSEIINAAKEAIPNNGIRKAFYEKAIDAFEDEDWDTQDECIDMDEAFDEALKTLHPKWYKEEAD